MASVTWSAAAAGSGALAALPLMLTGWVAEKVHLDWLDEVREITREFALILFGTKRKVSSWMARAPVWRSAGPRSSVGSGGCFPSDATRAEERAFFLTGERSLCHGLRYHGVVLFETRKKKELTLLLFG